MLEALGEPLHVDYTWLHLELTRTAESMVFPCGLHVEGVPSILSSILLKKTSWVLISYYCPFLCALHPTQCFGTQWSSEEWTNKRTTDLSGSWRKDSPCRVLSFRTHIVITLRVTSPGGRTAHAGYSHSGPMLLLWEWSRRNILYCTQENFQTLCSVAPLVYTELPGIILSTGPQQRQGYFPTWGRGPFLL